MHNGRQYLDTCMSAVSLAVGNLCLNMRPAVVMRRIAVAREVAMVREHMHEVC